MGYTMIGIRLDGRISMTWVTCAAGVAAVASLVGGGSGLLMGGVDWIYWVVNTYEVQKDVAWRAPT